MTPLSWPNVKHMAKVYWSIGSLTQCSEATEAVLSNPCHKLGSVNSATGVSPQQFRPASGRQHMHFCCSCILQQHRFHCHCNPTCCCCCCWDSTGICTAASRCRSISYTLATSAGLGEGGIASHIASRQQHPPSPAAWPQPPAAQPC